MTAIDRRSMMAATAAGAGSLLTALPAAAKSMHADPNPAAFEHLVTRHRTVEVNGLDIFYREAGRANAPAVLLLHGFPASSHMFRHLIPALAEDFRVIAPDYPGFGNSSFPPRDVFNYTFDALAHVMRDFTARVGLTRYAMYVQDYGAPVGLRLALKRTDAIAAIISQNGNAYAEGLSKLWEPIKAYWSDPSPRNRAVLRNWLSAEGTHFQYSAGLRADQIERLAPDTWTLDWQKLSRTGNAEAQIDLFGDYQSNVALYPEFQRFLREHRPPALVLWGKNDPFFTVQGAKAFLRDLPNAELQLVDGSHFLLETHAPYIAYRVRRFLRKALA